MRPKLNTPCLTEDCTSPAQISGGPMCLECSIFDKRLRLAQRLADRLFNAWIEAPTQPIEGSDLVKLASTLDVTLKTWCARSGQSVTL